MRRLLDHAPGSLLVAEEGGEVVGVLIAAWDGWRGGMYRLAVRPERRRRGIGRLLVEAGEAHLRRAARPRDGTGRLRGRAGPRLLGRARLRRRRASRPARAQPLTARREPAYQGTGRPSRKKPPVGPSSGRSAARRTLAAPCHAARGRAAAHVGAHPARADGVDQHAVAVQAIRQQDRRRVQRRLGDGVGRVPVAHRRQGPRSLETLTTRPAGCGGAAQPGRRSAPRAERVDLQRRPGLVARRRHGAARR